MGVEIRGRGGQRFRLVVCDRCRRPGAAGHSDPEARGRCLSWGWQVRYGALPDGRVGLFCPYCVVLLDQRTQGGRSCWAG